MHHTPPQHLPPAKRQRFDGPNSNRQPQHHALPPPQPQFQPPPPPAQNIGVYSGQNQGHGRGGGSGGLNNAQLNANKGGASGNRGGMSGGGRGARGGSMSGNRGGMASRGRGNGYMGSGGGGGRGGGQSSGSVRAHGSRGNFGGGHNRRGGSFAAGNYSHQGSFRHRQGANRGGRHDGGSSASFGTKDGAVSNFGSVGKKDENRRTLTDFKIIGLEIPDLAWSWGILPSPASLKTEDVKDVNSAEVLVKNEQAEASTSSVKAEDTFIEESSQLTDARTLVGSIGGSTDLLTALDIKPAQDGGARRGSDANLGTPPPSRMRIYFHTPVTADDSRPIPHSSSFTLSVTPSDSRRGKRKKLEEDDGDLEEEARVPPPPPQMTVGDDRSSAAPSAAPSVAETASEADWLMAAIEGEEEAETELELHAGCDDEEGDHINVTQLVSVQNANGVPSDSAADVNTDLILDGNADVKMNETFLPEDAALRADDDGGAQQHCDADGPVGDAHEGAPRTVVHAVGIERSEGDIKSDSQQSDGANLSAQETFAVSSCAAAPSDSSDPASVSLQLQGATAVPSVSISVDEHPADHIGSPDSQVTQNGSAVAKSLQALSRQPTLLNIEESQDAQDGSQGNYDATGISTQPVEDENVESSALPGDDATQPEHLPEPPASPTSNTLPSNSSSSAYGNSPTAPTKPEIPGGRTPSANRLSISYAGGNRRLVIDAEVVQSFKLFRQEGRIEVILNVDKELEDGLKGTLLEGLSDVTKSYHPIQPTLEAAEADSTLPPFANSTSAATLFVYLDTARPLSEPKWAKTGDVQDWLKSMFGRMFWVAGDAAEGWEKKIQVVDPDPPPTIWTVLEGWSQNSPVGALNERQRFLKTHMTETDNLLEILLRLVRGERATPFSQSTPTVSAPSVSGPLLSALAQGSAHGAQQTHVSLAVLAIFRMATEYAIKASGDKGKSESEERIGEIIRCLPSHLIYKSLDGIFKEWRVEKKGR
ncbi:hypothetical protein JOM56_008335 [Amanita muscaria]